MPEQQSQTVFFFISFIVLVSVCTFLLFVVNKFTEERIDENKLIATYRIINDVIPPMSDNDIFDDTIEITEPDYLGTIHKVKVYRSRSGGVPTGVIFHPVIANGYSGPIELTIGITNDGVVSGVRVISENETKDLGDGVNQANSDWIYIFTGQSFATIPRDQWTTRSDAGYFDQLSGATITSRAVINVIKSTLDYHDLASSTLYEGIIRQSQKETQLR